MSPCFEIKNLQVSYGKEPVVRQAFLQLHAGELCALLGLNGSGKTTLLRACCGLLPSSGELLVGTESLRAMNERRRARHIAFIPQAPSPIHGKSVMEVLLMGCNPHLHLLESPGEAHRQAALRALERLEISHFSDKMYHTLSQGQKQLVILARTLVQNAPIMLMDEPDSALDYRNRHMILSKIRALVKAEEKACLITLHDPNFAMTYCDRLILMDKGRVTGEIHMHEDSEARIREALTAIYGPITLIRHENTYRIF